MVGVPYRKSWSGEVIYSNGNTSQLLPTVHGQNTRLLHQPVHDISLTHLEVKVMVWSGGYYVTVGAHGRAAFFTRQDKRLISIPTQSEK